MAMLIDLIDKLIDRCIELVGEGQQVRKDLLANFGEPLLEEFEKVHDNYLETCRRYRTLVNSSAASIDSTSEIFDAIREDIVFAAGYRERLSALSRATDDPIFGEFIAQLGRYLQTPFDIEPSEGFPPPEISNVPRETLLEELQNAIDGSVRYTDPPELEELMKTNWPEYTKRAAVKVIDGVVLEMQRRYGDAQDAYQEARKQLLS